MTKYNSLMDKAEALIAQERAYIKLSTEYLDKANAIEINIRCILEQASMLTVEEASEEVNA